MNGFYNLIELGAVPDGKTKCTDVFKKAIALCKEHGGGTLFVPAGTYLTGPIALESHINLHLSAGALVRFSPDPEEYPFVRTRWEGTECWGLQPMLFGYHLENVSVTGKGILDGQGEHWWKHARLIKSGHADQVNFPCMKKLNDLNAEVLTIAGSGGGGLHSGYVRPPLIQFMECRNVTLDGITARNSAFWNTHILYCADVTIHDAKFINPDSSPNTDGLDIDSSRGVRVSDCTFDVGDDCVVIKSGMDEDGVRVGRPTEFVAITNCTMLRGHGGVVFGSEISGGVRNIVISNCLFNGTDRGIRIKSRRERGGFIENVRISNIVMENVISPLVFNLFYECGHKPEKRAFLNSKEPQAVTKYTPFIRNFQISNISSYKTLSACGVFFGLPEMPIEGIHVSDVLIEMDKVGARKAPAMNFDDTKLQKAGFVGSFLKNCSFRNINVIGVNGPAVDLADATGVEISGLVATQDQKGPLVKMKNCVDCHVAGKVKDGDIEKA
jgi:polygalacturonase